MSLCGGTPTGVPSSPEIHAHSNAIQIGFSLYLTKLTTHCVSSSNEVINFESKGSVPLSNGHMRTLF
jgi:hypothetical protein